MEKYESRQHQIFRPAMQIYNLMSDFSKFTPVVSNKVDDWQATPDTCSFKVKGMTLRLRIVDKVPGEYVKIASDEGNPLDFTLWLQFKEVGPLDTRMRLVMHAQLNMMMKMMIGSKLQDGIEQMAEQMALALNGLIPPAGYTDTRPVS